MCIRDRGDKALPSVDHRHVTPAGEGKAEVEQPVLKRHTGNRDRLTLEQREIGNAQHAGLVVLQEHQEQAVMELEKNQACFFMMLGMNML